VDRIIPGSTVATAFRAVASDLTNVAVLPGAVACELASAAVAGSQASGHSQDEPASSRAAAPDPADALLRGGLVCADEIPDGLVVAGAGGRVIVFNRAAARLTGITPAAAIGRDITRVLPLQDAQQRDWWASPQPYQGLCTRTRQPEQLLYLPDGTELLVCASYVRDVQTAGQPAEPDLLDRPGPGWHAGPGPVRRITLTLRGCEQRDRLERSRADLVSTVAHELRSPLTSVKGFTATLLAKWPRFTDDQKRVMLETVNADADRVTRLITELLDVSRIEAGRIELHRQLVDIPAQARKLIAGRVCAGDPEDKFRLEVAGDLPETWLDADKVDQILANLIENAIRHGAGTVTIVVERAQSVGGGPGVAVSVRDQGPGIDPEAAGRVFRQFWRAKRRGGAGLGLFIVKGLVEAHGGAITVQQAPGGGADFRFTLPAGAPESG
jgi:signal transduction histidine kinase